jgi:GNAT superfamily N-acetyltransferase
MNLPDIQSLYDATDATWPSASATSQNGWIIKSGAGGGKRVSAALQTDPSANIDYAEQEMQTIGQDRLFQIRTGEDALDSALASRGYDLIDRVVLLVAPLSALKKSTNIQSTDTPNSALKQIWSDGGIGPTRLDVMNRATCPKSIIHIDDRAVAYVGIHNGICMAHAVEVSKNHRRQGLGKQIMHATAQWAENQGAEFMAVITVMDNIAARTLYQNLGMTEVGHYHYRIKPHRP